MTQKRAEIRSEGRVPPGDSARKWAKKGPKRGQNHQKTTKMRPKKAEKGRK